MPFPSSPEIRCLLLDIEGTTTPIDFVFKTLFPFASAHVETFLRSHSASFEVQEIIAELRSTWSGAASSGAPVWVESTADEKLSSAAAYIRWLISRDSKITPLKTLQGKIWEEGFRNGELKGEIYSDVAPALVRWRAQNKAMAIFSSGSVLAQKLLFAHSTAGDLSEFLSTYFDTTTGPKREPSSYQKIAAALQLSPPQILFISDVPAELDAARAVHLHTAHSLRPGIAAQSNPSHSVVRTFDEVFPESN